MATPANKTPKAAAAKKKPSKAPAKKGNAPSLPSQLFTKGVIPAERYYPSTTPLQYVVVSGTFDGLSPDLIRMRLQQRNLFIAPTAGPKVFPSLVGAFLGTGASATAVNQLQKLGVSACGADELRALIKTPLVGIREHFEANVREWGVRAWRMGAPATSAEIASAEKLMGCALPASLVAFYSQCDGLAAFADGYARAKKTPLPAQASEDELAALTQHRSALIRLFIPSLALLARHRVDPSLECRVGKKLYKAGTLRANRIDLWDPFYPAIVMPDTGDGVWLGDDHGVAYPWGPVPFEEYLWEAVSRDPYARKMGKFRIGELKS